MSEIEPYRSAAHDYWVAGWHGVLPLPIKRKGPPPQGFTGETGVWPSYADVQAWVDGGEGSGNIAIRVPPDVLGIDVDHYDAKHGGDTLDKYSALWGTLPATWVSTSRNDGISGIKLFRVPEGLKWPGELGPDIELIQYTHRYAVVASSQHPSGRRYVWISPYGTTGIIPPNLDDLPDLPPRWVEGITGGELASITLRAELHGAAVSSWLMGHSADQSIPSCARVSGALDRGLADLSTGSRHSAARATVLRLVRLAGEGHPGTTVAIDVFRTAFLDACSDVSRVARKAGEAQVEFSSVLTGAVNLVVANPTPYSETDPCDLRGLISAPGRTSVPPEESRPSVAQPSTGTMDPALAREIEIQRIRRQAKQFLDNEALGPFILPDAMSLDRELALPDIETPFRVYEVMPTGSNVLLAAQFKTGKTSLINHFVKCLVDDQPFLGRFAPHEFTGRVAILNYEVGAQMYRRWMREVGIINADRVALVHLRGIPFSILNPRAREWLVKWLRDHGITVLILDPFGAAYYGNENDNQEVASFLSTVDSIKSESGVQEFVLVSHTGRERAEVGMEHVRGASRLDDWADARWLLTKDADDNRYFRAHGRDVDVPEVQIRYDQLHRSFVIAGGSRADSQEYNVTTTILTAIANNPGISFQKLRSYVRETLGGIGNPVVDSARDALIKAGRVLYVPPTTPGASGKHYLATSGNGDTDED